MSLLGGLVGQRQRLLEVLLRLLEGGELLGELGLGDAERLPAVGQPLLLGVELRLALADRGEQRVAPAVRRGAGGRAAAPRRCPAASAQPSSVSRSAAEPKKHSTIRPTPLSAGRRLRSWLSAPAGKRAQRLEDLVLAAAPAPRPGPWRGAAGSRRARAPAASAPRRGAAGGRRAPARQPAPARRRGGDDRQRGRGSTGAARRRRGAVAAGAGARPASARRRSAAGAGPPRRRPGR